MRQNIKCIIVDSDKEAGERLASLLKHFPFVELISLAADTDEAIELIIKTQPALVFLEVEMPGRTGFDIVMEARANFVNSDFVFVTAHKQYAIKALRNAALDYLIKPVDIEELKKALERFNSVAQVG